MITAVQTTKTNAENFSLHKTLECGQVFRYKKLGAENYLVFSGEKACHAYLNGGRIVLQSDSPDYFYRYFDLSTNYAQIEKRLSIFDECRDAVRYGEGLHILKQDLFETIISFIISANNNIPRIQGILSKLCERVGMPSEISFLNPLSQTGKPELRTENYYAFPTPQQLAALTENNFREMGCGYRAPYLRSATAELADGKLLGETIQTSTENAAKLLSKLKGVGPKVRDCILLFGLNRTDRYPVDTWVFKASKSVELCTPEKVRDYFTARYGELSGYAQQYVFYYGRSGASK